MIESKVLETYSPVIIPVSFIFGLNFIEKDLIYDKLSPLGFLIFSLSLFLFADRAENTQNDSTLYTGSALFVVSYILLRYTPSLYKFSLLCLATSLVLIGQGVIKYDIYDKNVQLIYFSLFMIFIYFVFYVNSFDRLDILIPSIFYTILVLSSINMS